MNLRSRAAAVALLAVAGLALLAGPLASAAAAHVSLTDSTPAYGAQLAAAPTELVLRFDASFEVSLANASLDRGTSEADASPVADLDRRGAASGYATSVTFAAPASMADGPYRLRWTLYALDGHTMSGVIPFTVGAAAAPTTTVVPASTGVAAPPARSAGTGPAETLGERSLAVLKALAKLGLYLSLALVVGALFWAKVPVHRRFLPPVREAAATAARWALVGVAIGGASLAAVNLVNAVRADVTGSRPLALVISGNQVWPWLLLAAVAAVAVGGVRLVEDARGLPSLAGAPAAAAAGLVGAIALAGGGHGTETTRPALTIALLALHVAAVACWMGPVLMLTWLRFTPVGRQDHFVKAIRPGLRRFTPVALGAAAVVVVSGLRASWAIGGSAVPSGHYGWLLAAKVSVALLAVAPWGAGHLFALRRAERGGGTPALRATLLAEAAGFATVALLAAALSATAHS